MKPLSKYLKSYCKWNLYLWFFIIVILSFKMLLMDYRIANRDKMISGVDLAII